MMKSLSKLQIWLMLDEGQYKAMVFSDGESEALSNALSLVKVFEPLVQDHHTAIEECEIINAIAQGQNELALMHWYRVLIMSQYANKFDENQMIQISIGRPYFRKILSREEGFLRQIKYVCNDAYYDVRPEQKRIVF